MRTCTHRNSCSSSYSAISSFSPEMEFKEHDTLVEAGIFGAVRLVNPTDFLTNSRGYLSRPPSFNRKALFVTPTPQLWHGPADEIDRSFEVIT
jgi:hypothetical protein